MKIGPYEVLLELGRGGMGTVYLARLVGVGGFERLVAIKRAHAAALAQKGTAERFLREARLAASVHHANVVGIHQVGEDQDGQYLACDYVEGEALDRLIEGNGTPAALPVAIALRIVLDALSGLHAAHETVDGEGKPLGILHRDVSIENLLVGRDGVTRLTDFGIAKTSHGPGLTDAGTIHGKLMYLTPEYLQGAESQRRDDTYAMGVTLWIALSGAFPFRGRDNAALTHEVLSQPIPRLSSMGVSVGPLLDAGLTRALSRDPEARFQTARAMLDALEDASARETPAARHLDVADFVERMAGERLAQRRSKIQAGRASEVAAAPAAARPADAVIFDTLQNVTIESSPRDKRRWPRFLALLASAALLAFWLVTRTPGSERDALPEAEPRPTSAAPSVEALPTETSAVPEPESAEDAAVPLAPQPAVEARDIAREQDRDERRPTRPRPARPQGSENGAPEKPRTPTPPAPALDITTDNPYR